MKITLNLDNDEVAEKVWPFFGEWLKECIPVVEVRRGRSVLDIGHSDRPGRGLVIDVANLHDAAGLDEYETAEALLKALEACAAKVRKQLDEWPSS